LNYVSGKVPHLLVFLALLGSELYKELSGMSIKIFGVFKKISAPIS
jgi:hypothetical protein